MKLGDMMVLGRALPPQRLLRALEVIEKRLHPTLAEGGLRTQDSCILLSLAVTNFLCRVGFRARMAPVALVIQEITTDGPTGHSLGVGVPDDTRKLPGRWAGHMVVICEGWLIDTTLMQAKRPQWPTLPDMIAIPVKRNLKYRYMDLPAIACFGYGKDGVTFDVAWYANPKNDGWQGSPDTMEYRRAVVVDTMVREFNHVGG